MPQSIKSVIHFPKLSSNVRREPLSMTKLNDYLIEQNGHDWQALLSDWDWMLPSVFTILFVNRFGDLFIKVNDGSIHMLDIGVGTLDHLASDWDNFCTQLDQWDNADQWLMIPLVDKCVSSGLVLGPDQCYSYKNPPILGGIYTVENVSICNLSVHYSFQGQILQQIKDLPDGTRVKVRVIGDK